MVNELLVMIEPKIERALSLPNSVNGGQDSAPNMINEPLTMQNLVQQVNKSKRDYEEIKVRFEMLEERYDDLMKRSPVRQMLHQGALEASGPQLSDITAWQVKCAQKLEDLEERFKGVMSSVGKFPSSTRSEAAVQKPLDFGSLNIKLPDLSVVNSQIANERTIEDGVRKRELGARLGVDN